MEFASATFIFVFLPIVFVLYLILPWNKVRNWILIVASLLFYAWGEPMYVLLMLVSVTVNYFMAQWIERLKNKQKCAKPVLIATVVFNTAFLVAFKYTGFMVQTVNDLFSVNITVPSIISPLGISFFTFQILSYVIDVYRGQVQAARKYSRILLYTSFFAQLLQGPIIRYGDIESQLFARNINAEKIADGLRLFIIGLSMKLLIANTLGGVTATIFSLEPNELNAAYAWSGAICFLLQIYFDFAGYSKMAIGLGSMFGFTIPQNFNYPYIARSMTDFWRRWHITLSRWFRDYIYIPMGGNRGSAFRTCLNKSVVFLLTGLWHGASWTFVAWGIYNGFFLILESLFKNYKVRIPRAITTAYTIVVVTVGFVIFNSPNMSYAFAMIGNMFIGFDLHTEAIANLSTIFTPMVFVTLAIGIIAATPIAKILCSKLDKYPVAQQALRYSFAVILLVLCMFALASGNFNPSIYTQF